MFNAFGDNQSIGVARPPGKNAFDLIKWAPHATKRIFRESEKINIYFDTATDGIVIDKKGKPFGLKIRAGGPAIDLVRNFPTIRQIRKGNYMLEPNNSLFEVSPMKTGVISPSLIIFAMSFKGMSYNVKPRVLFANESLTRGISIQDRNGEGFLTIFSSGPSKELSFDRNEWSTLLI